MIIASTKHLIGRSKDNKLVYAYLTREPLVGVIAHNPHIAALIREAITTQNLTRSEELIERDMGRSIGHTDVVTTKDEDVIFYAQQVKHEQYTRFVKQRKTESTRVLFFSLSRDDQGHYQLTNANLGKKPIAFPLAQTPHGKNDGFWGKHAVAYNGQLLKSGTTQKMWPSAA